ncbi:MAG TPA: autotransporter domain-containing protein, partial [Orrella sp.]
QEQTALASDTSWQDEGDIFGAFDRAWPGAQAYYRFHNATSGQYFFEGNLNAVLQNARLDYGGISWYAAAFVAQPDELFFSRDDALVLTDYIRAESRLVTKGNGSLTLAAGGHFSGGIEVAQGRLVVNGLLSGGDLTVRPGGTLGGNATIVNRVNIQGRLAPGNSAGTIAFLAPVTMTAGSTLEIEVDGPTAGSGAGSYDRVVVLGSNNTFTAAGKVDVLLRSISAPASNDFTPSIGQQFVGIVSAQGGIRDSFLGLQQPPSGLMAGTRLDLIYGNQSIDLVVTPANYGQLAAAGLSQTTNEQAVGSALDAFRPAAGVKPLGPAGEIFPALAPLPGDQIAAALANFSGELYASLNSPIIESSRFMRQASLDRIRTGFGGVATSARVYANDGQSLPGTSGNELASSASTLDRRAVGWAQPLGSWGQYSNDGNAAQLTYDTRGLLIGLDVPVTDAWRLGTIAGFGHSNADVAQRDSSADINTYSLGLYGGGQWDRVGLRLGASYAWHDVSASRTVVFTGFSDDQSASYQAKSAQFFGELGYQLDFMPARTELFTGLAHVRLSTPYFSESGGVSALQTKGSNSHTTFTTVGVRSEKTFNIRQIKTTARGMVGWQHASGDTTPTSTHAFVLGPWFSVNGVAIAQNAAVLNAGIDLQVGQQATIGIYYEGQFASGSQQHSVSASLNVLF